MLVRWTTDGAPARDPKRHAAGSLAVAVSRSERFGSKAMRCPVPTGEGERHQAWRPVQVVDPPAAGGRAADLNPGLVDGIAGSRSPGGLRQPPSASASLRQPLTASDSLRQPWSGSPERPGVPKDGQTSPPPHLRNPRSVLEVINSGRQPDRRRPTGATGRRKSVRFTSAGDRRRPPTATEVSEHACVRRPGITASGRSLARAVGLNRAGVIHQSR
jgi:hypothetical protein